LQSDYEKKSLERKHRKPLSLSINRRRVVDLEDATTAAAPGRNRPDYSVSPGEIAT